MKQTYDAVVIGGGPNGLGIAGYLAKAGLKVCVCEERFQLGGAAENVEVIPGFRIDPHATYLYGAAAPVFEDLELHRFGLQMRYFKTLSGAVTTDGKAVIAGRFNIEESFRSLEHHSLADATLLRMLYETFEPLTAGFLRSIFWTPPYPPGSWSSPEELPWFRFLKEKAPGALNLPFYNPQTAMEMSTYELLDLQLKFEPMKVMMGQGAWYNGPFPAWRGMGIFGLATGLLMSYSSGCPKGGMHSFMHALIRACVSYGVKFYVNTPVREIVVEDGEAKGVIIGGVREGELIRAERLVISAVDVKQTFLKLMGGRFISKDLLQKIREVSLHGGSLFVLHLIVKELPRYKGEAEELFFRNGNYPSVVCLPADSREFILNQARDIFSFRTHPTRWESMHIMICCHDIYDETRCPPGYHVLSPIYIQVPPPEYHRDGPLAVNREKEKIADMIIETIRQFAPNMTPDNIVARFINTPYDSEYRNVGLIGGNWYAIRECEDQWWGTRPIPELARYRTPIHKLYLCNQTSYPGGLCLFAVPYNLMHILIDDGAIPPPPWFKPSPYHIPDQERRYP
jgi:phytoene dehydrogenase-like protein